MKLDSIVMVTLGNSGVLEESIKNVEEHDGSRAIVVGTGSSAGTTVVGNDRVKMRTGDDGLEADLSRDRNHDRWLRPGLMLNQPNCGKRVLLDDLLDLLVKPFSGFNSVF